MRRFLICLLFLFASAASAAAQTVQPFSPTAASVSLSVSSVSSRVALPSSGPTALVVNTGAATAYLNFGNSSVAATTSGIILSPGCAAALNANGQSYLAAITSASTTTLSVATGSGLPTLPNSGCTLFAQDANGAVVTKPFSLSTAQWQYTGSLSSGTQTAIHASCGTGLRNYTTNLDWSGVATTTAVTLTLQDGSTGIWADNIPAGAIGRTYNWSIPKQGTAATAANVQLSGSPTGAVIVNASGYCAP